MISMKAERKKSKVKKIVCFILAGAAVFFAVEWSFIGWRYNFGPLKFLGEIRLQGMPGNGASYDFSHIEPMENSPLEGKNVLFLNSVYTSDMV